MKMDDRDKNFPSSVQPSTGVGGPKTPDKKKPPYKKMISEAIQSMQEKRGSSRQSIFKYLSNKYPLGRGSSTRINNMLNRMVHEKRLIQTKGTGSNGSFKINKLSAKEMNNVPGMSAGSKRSRRGGRRRKPKRRRGRRGRRGRKRRGRKRKGKKRRRGRRGRKGRRRRGRKSKRRGRKRRGRKRRGRRRGKKRSAKKNPTPAQGSPASAS